MEGRQVSETNSVTYGDDPTEAVLSKSALHKKDLCDYVINTATGCRHGCSFCYVPSTPQIRTRPDMLAEQADVENPQQEWGDYVLHRESADMAETLRSRLANKRTWKTTPGGRGIVALSFSTDCYQDATTADATRACVRELVDAGKHVRILTRNPINALQDLDIYREAADEGLVTVGSSIPSLDREKVAAIEQRAPAPEHRLRGLEKFSEAGIPVFVSMSPTYPTASRRDLRGLLETFQSRLSTLDVVFHEAINPRGGNFQQTIRAAQAAGEHHLAARLGQLRDRDVWRRYAVRQLKWVADLSRDVGVDVNLWPGKNLVRAAEGTPDEQWVRGEWMARSPEDFANGGN